MKTPERFEESTLAKREFPNVVAQFEAARLQLARMRCDAHARARIAEMRAREVNTTTTTGGK